MARDQDEVGSQGGSAVGGGHQTAQQAAITGMGGEGVSDAERNADWREAGGTPGRPPVSVGGSSEGHSDQKAGQGADEDEKVAGGQARAERDGGR